MGKTARRMADEQIGQLLRRGRGKYACVRIRNTVELIQNGGAHALVAIADTGDRGAAETIDNLVTVRGADHQSGTGHGTWRHAIDAALKDVAHDFPHFRLGGRLGTG